MTESFIFCDNEYYKEHNGVAKGSALGPTLANIFLCAWNSLAWEKDMMITLFYFFKISVKLENSNTTLTSNMPILNLPLWDWDE